MNVLLVGGEGTFMASVIREFEKNGHRVFLLTGCKKNDKTTYPGVFERYDFPCSSESVQEIVKSVSPEAVLFLAHTIPIIPGMMQKGMLCTMQQT